MVYCPVSLEEGKWDIIKWWGIRPVLCDPGGGALGAALKRRRKSWETDNKDERPVSPLGRTVFDSLQPRDYSQPGSSAHGISGSPLLPPGDLPRDRTGASYSPLYWQADSGFPGGPRGEEPPATAGDTLEEEMATHSCILAWRIPWIEERDRLRPRGSQSPTSLKPLSSHTGRWEAERYSGQKKKNKMPLTRQSSYKAKT